ncbi:50S ribosomal protein L10 [Halarsenatibacter silvermanii]|uniref:Large ribosomal subunit protein uL10 n=1 Tax=Halarsenatibacter silvermanii TaxID=321763 RepID=A0A1G9T4G6_9FIRM|nr:50S ribosomal protein L10 [Halarsenatibacter silvermanii]SDM42571.1 LSU ribosomal protein L10P [Halarsenatibacter silvermanii]
MVKPEKKAAVEELKEKFDESQSMVFTDFVGIDVETMTELREELREAGVEYKVVKNTLASIAADECEIEEIKEYFVGPTAIAFGMEDAVSPARVIVDFAEALEDLEIKGGFLNNQLIDQDRLESLAEVPSREALLGQVLAGMQSPLTGLVRVLNGNVRGLVQVLNRIKEQKED